MNRPNRHTRQNAKFDRLLYPAATSEDIRMSYACSAFDRAALLSEQTWGIDKLPALVSTETAARYASAMSRLNAALQGDDPAVVAHVAAVCVRGLAAMDAEARAAGHAPIPADVWQLDGGKIGIIRDERDWPAVAAAMPGLRIVTLREVANALAYYDQTVIRAAAAPIPRQRSETEMALNDEIPW